MRLFDLLNLQDVVLFLFPALVFIVLFGLALAYSRFHTPKEEDRTREIIYVFPDGIEDRRAPFPLALDPYHHRHSDLGILVHPDHWPAWE